MLTRFIPTWKIAPSLRFLLPLIVGIILQWYFEVSLQTLAGISIAAVVFFFGIMVAKVKSEVFQVFLAFTVVALIGSWLVLLSNQKNHNAFIGRYYADGKTILATLQEPLAIKAKSYKAEAAVSILDSNGIFFPVTGHIIIYFKKDSLMPPLVYGSQIVFNQPLQAIKNAGNPGGFNYERNALFQGLFYQVYLKPGDFVIDEKIKTSRFKQALFTARDFVLQTFKTYIPGNAEAGLAEALLVGYRDDLDKNLVEQYASTGVVHIIAISGMHLGLIYGVLIWLMAPLGKKKNGKIIRGIIIILALWFFSFLTGAAPSITRSALMFTLIVVGESVQRKSSIYNSLSISACVLLLINPFNLWDVGFQLSYAAVLSIAVFGKAIQNWVNPTNKILQFSWQLIAITLAAQILTLPLVLYHFHQFPIYFLLANIVAVPLSSIILYGLLLLLLVAKIPMLASVLGVALHYAIKGMNNYIYWINSLPFSTISNLYFTMLQTIAFGMVIILLAWWLFYKNPKALLLSIGFGCIYFGLNGWQFFQNSRQQKLIVYNVPGLQAIDILRGKKQFFIGDTSLHQRGFLQNFHLLPSRILFQTSPEQSISAANKIVHFGVGTHKIILLNASLDLQTSATENTDVLVVGKFVKTKPDSVLKFISCNTVVLDGSLSRYKAKEWQIAADRLHLRLHSVQQQGAFIFNF